MRLSEALGLTSEDFKLDSDVPHLVIKPHQWRPLKTKASRRLIPLVGASLWAAQQVETSNQFAFPSYCDGLIMKSNSASQALNKWMGTTRKIVMCYMGFVMLSRPVKGQLSALATLLTSLRVGIIQRWSKL